METEGRKSLDIGCGRLKYPQLFHSQYITQARTCHSYHPTSQQYAISDSALSSDTIALRFLQDVDLEGEIKDSGVHRSTPSFDLTEHPSKCADIHAKAWEDLVVLETKIKRSHLSRHRDQGRAPEDHRQTDRTRPSVSRSIT